MRTPLTCAFLSVSLLLVSCGGEAAPPASEPSTPAARDAQAATDALAKVVAANTTGLQAIVTIDHSRLAEKEGVTMPPSVVTIYSDPAVSRALMRLNPRVGLDLPQKILAYSASGKAAVIYPGSSFLAARHGITDKEALAGYDAALRSGVRGIDDAVLGTLGGEGVARDLGIIELTSDFGYSDTIKRLKATVMKQGDTVWFGEIDFQERAGSEDVVATLLLFGGPKPGGVAMAEFPKLGLDAFCQKLLVYEAEGSVKVIFNDIAALAELHYGRSAKPHALLNQRLTATFKAAITKAGG